MLVVGGGAIGGITAAGLAGSEVVVLDADRAHVAALRSPGLRYAFAGREHVVALDAVSSVSELSGAFDFALIAVKAPVHAVALPPLVARGGIDTFVSMGNGLIQDGLAALVGGDLVACIVEWGGSNVGPGRLARDSGGGFMVGELDGVVRPRTRLLASVLSPVGEARVTANVRGMIWSKLLINSTFTGLSAVSGLRYGGVASAGPDAVFALWAEGLAVARALGVSLEHVHVDPYAFDAPALERLMVSLAGVRPSMLQDLDAGRATEVDVVNGGVASAGRSVGVPTPCNDAVVALVHAMERGEHAPDPRWLRHVADAWSSG